MSIASIHDNEQSFDDSRAKKKAVDGVDYIGEIFSSEYLYWQIINSEMITAVSLEHLKALRNAKRRNKSH